ncbi:TPA: DUF551 domain-containing protein [Klebsiella quasipneumoniae]
MTSKLTREERVQALYDLKVGQVLSLADIENVKMLARMALAAMDSETVEMPLDYLQGHKDGLEWAAQLAEANHPETGDWLYDDPIELAKAIRKGPDMPPVQPVADSEPVAWMHNNNDLGVPAITTNPKIGHYWAAEFKGVEPLYRHAQPAKTVQPVMFIDGDISSEDADKLAKVIRELHGKDERPLAKMARIIRENPHPTNECDMPKAQPAPVVPGKWISVSERMPEKGQAVLVYRPKAHEGGDSDVRVAVYGRHNFEHGFGCYWEPSHWMPLPAAPQEGK